MVCVAGAFDLLHPGHTRLLEQARGHGDILVVGLQSDANVQANLGCARPINPAIERAEIVAALTAVDYVTELDEPPCWNLLPAFHRIYGCEAARLPPTERLIATMTL